MKDQIHDPTFDAVCAVVKSATRALRAAVADVEVGRKGAVRLAVGEAKLLAQAVGRLDKMLQARPKVRQDAAEDAGASLKEARRLGAIVTLLDRMKRLQAVPESRCVRCGGL